VNEPPGDVIADVMLYRYADVIYRCAGDAARWLVDDGRDVTVRSWRNDPRGAFTTANDRALCRTPDSLAVDVQSRLRWSSDVWCDVTVGARCTRIVINTWKPANVDVIIDVIFVGGLRAAVGRRRLLIQSNFTRRFSVHIIYTYIQYFIPRVFLSFKIGYLIQLSILKDWKLWAYILSATR